MENVISARRLRKSMLKNTQNVDIEMYDLDKGYQKSDVKNIEKKEEKISVKFKNKIIFKFCICSLILFSIITGKMFFKEKIKESSGVSRIYYHYQNDFNKDIVLEKFEYQLNKIIITTGNIIPDKIRDVVKNNYIAKVKPFILNFNLQNISNGVLNSGKKENNSNVEIYEELTGVGGAEPLISNIYKEEKEAEFENKLEEAVSAISVMDLDLEEIKTKNINIICPLNGVITSKYGAREEIFNNVDPYHTGTDIAAKKGTNIISATKGKVTKVELGNKYYGNYVEVTENDVIFKYAHMDTINVKLNDSINQNNLIGTVGNTGMSTGPHLHFEIKINSRTVDAENLVKL